jgi:arylsulfatase A-like enzyme
MLIIAAWIGLLSGLIEAYYLIIWTSYLLHPSTTDPILFLDDHAIWMTPIGTVAFVLVVAGLLWLASRLWGRLATVRTFVLILAFPAFLGPIMATQRIHVVAGVLLAAGLGVQASRLVEANFHEFMPFARRSLGFGIVAIVGVVIVTSLWSVRLGHTANSPRPEGADRSPNVLLIVLDTQRAQSMSLYGYGRETTPELNRLAENGVVFDRAISTSSWTLPSHATLFTGRFNHDVRAVWNGPVDSRYKTLAEVLSSMGYATAGFVANLTFLDDFYRLDRGFEVWDDQPVTAGTIVSHSWLTRSAVCWLRERLGNHQDLVRRTAEDINLAFLDWLSKKKGDAPFFVFLNYYDPHRPYLPPKPFNLRFAPQQPLYWFEEADPELYTADELEQLVMAYDGSIAYLDHALGRLFETLQALDEFENTLVVITSDHGEEFGEHGLLEHGKALYMTLIHVPLLVFPPDEASGGTIAAPVSIRDIPATILDVVGAPEWLPGSSLAGYWTGARQHDARPPDTLLSELGRRHKSLIVGNLHYIRHEEHEELYDFASDPLERFDISKSARGRELLTHLRKALEARSGRATDPPEEFLSAGTAPADPLMREVRCVSC